jgi:hypothetical protein
MVIYHLDLSNVRDNRNIHKNCWAAYVKRLLFSNGLGFIWESQHLIISSNSKFYSNLIKTRIKDIFTQEMRNGISDNKKWKVFKSLNTDNRLAVSPYLLNINCKKHTIMSYQVEGRGP